MKKVGDSEEVEFLTNLEVVSGFSEEEAGDLELHIDEWGAQSASECHDFDLDGCTKLVDEDGNELEFSKLVRTVTRVHDYGEGAEYDYDFVMTLTKVEK